MGIFSDLPIVSDKLRCVGAGRKIYMWLMRSSWLIFLMHAALTFRLPPAAMKHFTRSLRLSWQDEVQDRTEVHVECICQVLVEGVTKDGRDFYGRTCSMKNVKLPDVPVPSSYAAPCSSESSRIEPGDYVAVRVVRANTGTLYAEPLARTMLQVTECALLCKRKPWMIRSKS